MGRIAYRHIGDTEIGSFFKEKRAEARYGRNEAALAISERMGVTLTPNVLNHWEAGRTEIPLWGIVAMCNLYQVSISKILTGSHE